MRWSGHQHCEGFFSDLSCSSPAQGLTGGGSQLAEDSGIPCHQRWEKEGRSHSNAPAMYRNGWSAASKLPACTVSAAAVSLVHLTNQSIRLLARDAKVSLSCEVFFPTPAVFTAQRYVASLMLSSSLTRRCQVRAVLSHKYCAARPSIPAIHTEMRKLQPTMAVTMQ